jgi:hypothetical protein
MLCGVPIWRSGYHGGMGGQRKIGIAGWLLMLASCVTVPLCLLVGGVVFVCWLTEPPTFPGDPNIGLGLLELVCILNVPVFVGWSLWLASKL